MPYEMPGLFVGYKPEPKTVRGIRILTKKEDLDSKLKKTWEINLTVPRGFLGFLSSLKYRGGFGNAETRAYNMIAARAIKKKASVALIDLAGNEAVQVLPNYSVKCYLYS